MKRLQNLKNLLFRNLRAKYKLVIMDSETFEEKLRFRLSRMNVITALGVIIIGLIFLTTYLIAFTSLKEFIPGYSNPGLSRDVYRLAVKADSLENALAQKDIYIENIKRVILGNLPASPREDTSQTSQDFSGIQNKRSQEDSLFRAEIESRDRYELTARSRKTGSQALTTIAGINFYTPVKGYITSRFNPLQGHYGIDIAAAENESVKTILDGTVIQSGWNMETGYVIIVQHSANLLSSYMHNAALLKRQGDRVRSGEPIAIFGSSGKLSSGIHLHFELWYNGTALDPEQYIRF